MENKPKTTKSDVQTFIDNAKHNEQSQPTFKDRLKFLLLMFYIASGILACLPVLFCRRWARFADEFYREINSDRI